MKILTIVFSGFFYFLHIISGPFIEEADYLDNARITIEYAPTACINNLRYNLDILSSLVSHIYMHLISPVFETKYIEQIKGIA